MSNLVPPPVRAASSTGCSIPMQPLNVQRAPVASTACVAARTQSCCSVGSPAPTPRINGMGTPHRGGPMMMQGPMQGGLSRPSSQSRSCGRPMSQQAFVQQRARCASPANAGVRASTPAGYRQAYASSSASNALQSQSKGESANQAFAYPRTPRVMPPPMVAASSSQPLSSQPQQQLSAVFAAERPVSPGVSPPSSPQRSPSPQRQPQGYPSLQVASAGPVLRRPYPEATSLLSPRAAIPSASSAGPGRSVGPGRSMSPWSRPQVPVIQVQVPHRDTSPNAHLRMLSPRVAPTSYSQQGQFSQHQALAPELQRDLSPRIVERPFSSHPRGASNVLATVLPAQHHQPSSGSETPSRPMGDSVTILTAADLKLQPTVHVGSMQPQTESVSIGYTPEISNAGPAQAAGAAFVNHIFGNSGLVPPARPPPLLHCVTVDKMPAQLSPRLRPTVLPPSAIPNGKLPESSAQSTSAYTHGNLFEMFCSALADPDTADKACRHLLSRFLGPDVTVQWAHLCSLDPVDMLLEAVSQGGLHANCLARPTWENGDHECSEWWQALLERHGLYGHGDAIGPEEFGELMVSAFRILRDCHAPASFLWNLRAVRRGSPRLKERYENFEFVSRGSLGKTYKCRSRLTREERSCRQIRKDWILSPTDQVRSEIALLRNIDHPNLPSIVETFEDYNSVYIVVDLVDGLELMTFLNQLQAVESSLTEKWVADVVRQILGALQYCHEHHPHSLVHGDLRLDSLVLAPTSDAALAPHIIIVDIGLAGLVPPPPQSSSQPSWMCAPSSTRALWAEVKAQVPKRSNYRGNVSPKRDIWSCGCLLYLLMTGRHPLDGDAGGPLVPLVSTPAAPWEAWPFPGSHRAEPDWALLDQVAGGAVPLCRQMLEAHASSRPNAGECLEHTWLVSASAGELVDNFLPFEALQSLVQLHARSKFRQVVTNLVVSELGTNPFETIATSLALLNDKVEVSESEGPAALPQNIARALANLQVSESSLKKVVRAFGDAPGCVPVYTYFFAGCANLAEDRFDHALWRIFTAAGEDHRGIISLEELERQLKDLPGTGDILSCMCAFLEKSASVLANEAQAAARRSMCGSGEVPFETLKEMSM